MSGKMPQNARNSHKAEATISKHLNQIKPTNSVQHMSEASGAQNEEQRIAAMFQQGADQWAQQQQAMAKYVDLY